MKSAFVHILGSSALAQMLLLLSMPFLMRLYGAEDFGVFGLYTVFAMGASTLSALKIDHSLHLTKFPCEVFSACIEMASGSILAILIVVAFVGQWIDVNNVVAMLVFGGAHAIVTSCTMMGNLRKRYRLVAFLNLVAPLVFIVLAVAFADSGFALNHLLLAQAIAYFLGALLGVFYLREDLKSISLSGIMKILKLHREDVIFLVPSRFIAILSSNAMVLGAAFLFNAELAGLVVVATRVARTPVRVFGDGLSNTLRTTVGNRIALARAFTTVALVATVVGISSTLVIGFLPESVFTKILGDQWQGLKFVILVSAVAAAFQLLSESVGSVLTTFRKSQYFVLNAALALTALIAALICYVAGLAFESYLVLTTVLMSLIYLSFFYSAWKTLATDRKERSVTQPECLLRVAMMRLRFCLQGK